MSQILLVGCGKMGGAMLAGWLARGRAPESIIVVEPGGLADPPHPALRVVASADEIPADFVPEVVVLAVKPQGMAEMVPAYARFRDAVFLSIAAGRPIAFFEKLLGPDYAVVRAMPNTPAAVRAGITAVCVNSHTTLYQSDLCTDLLEAVGAVVWINDEALMDAVTAVSGSGPAYVFLLTECLAAAGETAGLPADLAMQLARATVQGAGTLMAASPEPPAVLRQNVTSKGGTTAAALAVLMAEDGLGPLMDRAVGAATRRSRELAG